MKTRVFHYFFLLWLILSNSSNLLAQDILAEANFSISDVDILIVEGRFCNVELRGNSESILKMDAWIKGNGNPDKYEIIYLQENNRLKVWVEYPRNRWDHIQGFMKFDIPRNVNVRIITSSGNQEVNKLNSENIELEATSGNINAEAITGNLEIRCTSGNLTLTNQAGDTQARTSSGNIRIDGVVGNLNVGASSGNLSIFDIKGNLTAECSSGNIRLRNIRGSIDARSTSGNIRGEEIMLTGISHFQATSGSITIRLLNEAEELSFDLDAGSGTLNALDNRADDRLLMRQGPLKIIGITTSGNQRYIKE